MKKTPYTVKEIFHKTTFILIASPPLYIFGIIAGVVMGIAGGLTIVNVTIWAQLDGYRGYAWDLWKDVIPETFKKSRNLK